MQANYLRPTRYRGDDDQMSRMSREVSATFKHLAENPLLGGSLFSLVDFSSLAGPVDRTYPLKHSFGTKANGVWIVECRPKDPTYLQVPTYPIHIPAQDDINTAYVAMSPYMANYYLWSFWVW